MMQLLCDGVRLDLKADTNIQLTHENPLFAFDNLKCERTTQFKLPRTSTNDAVFALARVPASNGAAMRKKFTAQMVDGVVSKDGYIYIDNWDGSAYNAIFVTGDLLGLQTIKNVGEINQEIQYNIAFPWDGDPIYEADAASIPGVAQVRYKQGFVDAHCVPSFSIKKIVDDMCAQIGATIDYSNLTDFENVRLVNTGKLTLDDMRITLSLTQTPGDQEVISLNSFLGIVQFVNARVVQWTSTSVYDNGYEWDTLNASMYHDDYISELSIPYDCTIKFPVDFPSTYYLVSGHIFYNSITGKYKDPVFLGDHGFYGWQDSIGSYGTLAGQTVSIPANTPFMLITTEGYLMPHPTSVGETGVFGYDITAVTDYSFSAQISVDHQFVYGENVPYNCLLPNCNLVELLKAAAAINGKLLDYRNDSIVFDDLDFDSMSTVEVTRPTKIGTLKRTFSDYAQSNIIEFKSPETMPSMYYIRGEYLIDNINIAEKKTLLTIPFSETESIYFAYTGDNGDPLLGSLAYVNNVGKEYEIDGTAIMRCTSLYNYMMRVSLPLNEGLVSLCDESTQLEIEANMSILEYNLISSDTKILFQGVVYMWTTRSWQKGIAKFTLAKIS